MARKLPEEVRKAAKEAGFAIYEESREIGRPMSDAIVEVALRTVEAYTDEDNQGLTNPRRNIFKN